MPDTEVAPGIWTRYKVETLLPIRPNIRLNQGAENGKRNETETRSEFQSEEQKMLLPDHARPDLER